MNSEEKKSVNLVVAGVNEVENVIDIEDMIDAIDVGDHLSNRSVDIHNVEEEEEVEEEGLNDVKFHLNVKDGE